LFPFSVLIPLVPSIPSIAPPFPFLLSFPPFFSSSEIQIHLSSGLPSA
jgi:hypothetical protein